MKKLSDYFEEDLNMMGNFIQSYVTKELDNLDPLKGYQLGILTCNFSYYGVLLRAEKRGENLSSSDSDFLKNISTIIDSFEGLIEHLILSYGNSLEALKHSDPRKYYQFMDSRGMHELSKTSRNKN